METLHDRLRTIRMLYDDARALGLKVPATLSDTEHIDVAVVGEIKRGKSTFLNALMGAKVFPSRALVCTSAVTVLRDGPAPMVTVRYLPDRGRETEQRPVPAGSDVYEVLMALVAKPQKRKDGMQGNPGVADIDEVDIAFPNSYATGGVRLVDTPGVNDPEAWREEITYRYLGRADAAIMLLDPQQPLSHSEVEFLRDKVQARVKDNLLFVLNKVDQITKPKDLEDSQERIRGLLKDLVPNPRLFPVASKPALDAILAGQPPGALFDAFTTALDGFLRRGRAGGLLVSRVQVLLEIVGRTDAACAARMTSIEQDDAVARRALDDEERRLLEERRRLSQFEQQVTTWIDHQRQPLAQAIRSHVGEWREAIGSNPHGVRSEIHQLRRDVVSMLEEAGASMAREMVKTFAGEAQDRAAAIFPRLPEVGDLAVGKLHINQTRANESGLGARGGAIIGMLVAGPIGALFGGIIGAIAGNQAEEQRQAIEEQRLSAALHEHLGAIEQAAMTRANELVAGVRTAMLPQLRRPWEEAITASMARVAASRSDLAESGESRKIKHRDLARQRETLQELMRRGERLVASWRKEL